MSVYFYRDCSDFINNSYRNFSLLALWAPIAKSLLGNKSGYPGYHQSSTTDSLQKLISPFDEIT